MKDSRRMPNHVAVLMDGNRRWAKKRKLPVVAGHRKVVEKRIEELIERAAEVGVSSITFWAFSTENWKRAEREVTTIMKLFRWALEKKANSLIKKGARVRYIGDLKAFPDDIRLGFEKLMKASENNSKINVTFALNYGGRDEIVRAVNEMIEDGVSRVTEKKMSEYLDTGGLPDPDLIIRTSGEQRLSGFMPWQSVYAEYYFPDTLMPDFGAQEFDKAIEVYGQRKRRYGAG